MGSGVTCVRIKTCFPAGVCQLLHSFSCSLSLVQRCHEGLTTQSLRFSILLVWESKLIELCPITPWMLLQRLRSH
jgi:hypothetical protein